MMDDRFNQQLHFLVEIDKMKTILRQTLLVDSSRQENDAEHSWHMAVMAMVLREYANDAVDLSRVLQMALVHDLIEIYAGDTFAYDERGIQSKAQREADAADRLFALLPGDQGQDIRALWEEFERMETPDAQYAAVIDRLQPLINNTMTEFHTWRRRNIRSAQVYRRMDIIRTATPLLWPFVEEVIADATAKGYLQP